MAVGDYNLLQPTGYQAISVSATPASSPTIPTPSAGQTRSNFALFEPETGAVRWRDDGTAPTSTVGFPLAVGQVLEYDGRIEVLQFISQAGTVTVHASYYRAD